MTDSYPEESSGGGSRNLARSQMRWLVTFGDLLTLLLCFFLSIVSFGPLNPTQRVLEEEVTKPDEPINPVMPPEIDSEQVSGPTIALTNSDTMETLLRFTEQDYVGGGELFTSEASEKMRSELEPEGYEVESVVVESCYGKPEYPDGRSWFMSVSRALGLRSQLIDAGVSPASISIRTVGYRCDAIREQDEEMVTRLTLTYTGLHRG